jgi:hypothetical protein
MVDALSIGQMYDASMAAAGGGAAFSNAWEQWEGVLITLTNVAAAGAPKSFGSTMPTPADNWSFGITGVAKIEGSLTDITMSNIARATCFSNATGVVDYFYDYLLLPRSAADMATGGTGCPVAEALCADSIDNDGNGFTDCNDDGCVVNATACRATTNVAAINAAIPTGGVELDNVFVLAVSFNKKNIWVSDSLTSAINKGIYVVGDGSVLPGTIVPGAKVNVIGRAKAYNNDTMGSTVNEVQAISIAFSAAPTTSPVAITGVNASAMANASYSNELVTLTQVKVSMVGDAMYHVGQLQQGATTFLSDDDIFRIPTTDVVGTCYSTITGIWMYQVFNNGYAFLPLAAGTPGSGC